MDPKLYGDEHDMSHNERVYSDAATNGRNKDDWEKRREDFEDDEVDEGAHDDD